MERLAIKRLSNSDLTFLKDYFDGPAGKKSKQKALNLNTDVFVDEFYPELQGALADTTIHVDLRIFGPGGADEILLARKIRKGSAYKNWRLNGEFIHTPDETPSRFDSLHEEDIAIIGFVGEGQPTGVYLDFVAASNDADEMLYQKLDNLIPRISSRNRKTMARISVHELKTILEEVNVIDSHPIYSFILDDDLVDAAQGDPDAQLRVYRRTGRKMSKDELNEAKQHADTAGYIGEELVDAYLQELKTRGEILDYKWTSQENAIAPFDFEIIQIDGSSRRLDVKTTKKGFKSAFHISMAELQTMCEDVPYDIYRVYNLDARKKTASLKVAHNVRGGVQIILLSFESLPSAVRIDSISCAPEFFPFAVDEVVIAVDG